MMIDISCLLVSHFSCEYKNDTVIVLTTLEKVQSQIDISYKTLRVKMDSSQIVLLHLLGVLWISSCIEGNIAKERCMILRLLEGEPSRVQDYTYCFTVCGGPVKNTS